MFSASMYDEVQLTTRRTVKGAIIVMNIELDATDRHLLSLLQQDARLPNKQLAESIGVAQSTCSSRMRRLEAVGAISGYHAAVEPRALGIGLQAMVRVTLIRHTNEEIGRFWEHIRTVPEVVNTFHMTGDTDFMVQVAVRDSEHLQEVATTTITSWPEVGRIRTAIIFGSRPRHFLPDLVQTAHA
jgi:DNA-binding Lrp family transcriptional regulator